MTERETCTRCGKAYDASGDTRNAGGATMRCEQCGAVLEPGFRAGERGDHAASEQRA